MNKKTDIEKDPELLLKKYREERDKRIRADGNEQYVRLEGDLLKYMDDPHVEPGFTRDPVTEDIDILIVGGGFAGLFAAYAFQKRGIIDLRIVEKAGDFGGTWYWNRYPDVRCDVESYIYLPLIEEFGDMPPEKYSRGSVIFEHAKKVGRELGLYDKTYFQTGVKEMRWDNANARWKVTTDRGDVFNARFVSVGSGPISRPKLPGIPGVETFKGKMFHTSRWDFHYTGGDEAGNLTGLADKRVAIIGTGATGIQCIPVVGRYAKQLFVVQRTPAAVEPRNNRPTDPDWWNKREAGWWKRRAMNFEGFLVGVPQEEDLIQDGWTQTWAKMADAARASAEQGSTGGPTIAQLVDFEKMTSIRARIDEIVESAATAEALKPWYNWMCKRPLFSDGYYETFNRPNVTLIDTRGRSLDKITGNSIVFDGVSHEVDCIIFASGFEVAESGSREGVFDMIGAKGTSLDEAWAQSGRRTLHGMFVHDFPNMGMILQIRQASTTWNVPYMLRAQTEHFADVVKRCMDGGIVSFDVAKRAESEWVKLITDNPAGNVEFIENCTPGYYNNEGGDAKTGLFANTYYLGPLAYTDLLRDWLDGGFVRDLELTTKSLVRG